MDRLVPDLEAVVLQHLDLKDVNKYLLQKEEPKIDHYLSKRYLTQLESRITQSFTEVNNLSHRHRIDIAKFFDLIRSTQSSISGGIVLQSILAEEWLDSDIDIYCHVSKVQTLVDFFKMNDNSHPRHEGRYPDLAVYNLMDQVITDNYYKVQLIVLKDDVSIPDFINTFDFDLNKVIYDGYRISSTVPLKKILSKVITFNSIYY